MELIRKIFYKVVEIINLSKENMDVSFLVAGKDVRCWAYIKRKEDYTTFSRAIDEHRKCNVLIHRFRETKTFEDTKEKIHDFKDIVAWVTFAEE